MEKIKLVIGVQPRTKKNGSRIVTLKNGRHILLPSKLYKDFEKACGDWIPEEYKGLNINHPVNVKCYFYCSTKRRIDLCNLLEAVDDMLVTYKVVKDDNRNIIAAHDGSRVYYDRNSPHLLIIIEDLEDKDYAVWNTKAVNLPMLEDDDE